MSYIGNQVTSVPFTVDAFSGNGTDTQFGPLVRAPATVASVAVFVNGSYKVPGVDYTLNGDNVLFTTAPGSGTNNIVVHHLGNGVMQTQVPAIGSVTSSSFAPSANTKIFSSSIAGSIIFGGS